MCNRKVKDANDFVVPILCGDERGQNVEMTEFPTAPLVVRVGFGQAASDKYAILKNPFVKTTEYILTNKDLGGWLRREKVKPSYERFANFTVLMYLCNAFDKDTAQAIA